MLRKGGKGDAEGRRIYREREEKGHFGEEKGMFRGRERGVSGRKIAEGIGIGREINEKVGGELREDGRELNGN